MTATGRCPVEDWKDSLEKTVRARIDARMDRLELGNFGDHKRLAGDLYELRFPFGPGYRLYYALDGEKIILLLCAGDKSSQQADIQKAQEFWKDYRSDRDA